ncbi:hypothetical protein ACT4UT_36570, partial [Bacillus sp. B-TM1]
WQILRNNGLSMTMPSADIQETVNMKISLIRQTNTFSLQVKKRFYQNLMRLRIRKSYLAQST